MKARKNASGRDSVLDKVTAELRAIIMDNDVHTFVCAVTVERDKPDGTGKQQHANLIMHGCDGCIAESLIGMLTELTEADMQYVLEQLPARLKRRKVN